MKDKIAQWLVTPTPSAYRVLAVRARSARDHPLLLWPDNGTMRFADD